MVPKIEQAKQVRASMTLQAQDIPSDRTLPREGVFYNFPFNYLCWCFNCQSTILSLLQNVEV